jgi:putative membrane protein
MWHYWDTMGFLGWTMMILFWVAVIVLIIWGVRTATTTRTPMSSDALTVLERRFASGEIEREEFEEKKNLLSRP